VVHFFHVLDNNAHTQLTKIEIAFSALFELKAIAFAISMGQSIVSLLAGTPNIALRRCFPTAHIVRMMPNLPLIYGEGVIGLSSDEKVQKEDKEHLTKIFEVLGKCNDTAQQSSLKKLLEINQPLSRR
jgi:pyrroline-5-carboxylate reductase